MSQDEKDFPSVEDISEEEFYGVKMQNETQDNAEIIIPEFGYSHYAHVWDDKTSNMPQTEKGDEVCVSACVCMCEFWCACGLWALKNPKICLDCRSNRIMYMRAFQKRNVPVKNCNMRKYKYTPCHKPKMEMRCVCVWRGGISRSLGSQRLS